MTKELEPCPFCGGEAETSHGLHTYEMWGVWCPSCKVQYGALFLSERDAIKAWNTRFKRTCHLVVDDHIRLPFESFFMCSECGERIQNKPFCPNCGAEVIE